MARPGRSRRAGRVILGIETSCDETAAARRHARRARSARTSSPRRPSCTRASAASCRRSRRGGTSSSSRRSCARRSARPGATLDDVELVARHARARADRRAARRRLGREGARVGARGCRSSPVDHLHGHVASLYLEPDPLEPPFLCLLASGGHTLLLDVRERGGYARRSARRSTTPPARRSTRARACSGSATRAAPRSTGSRARAIPEAFDFPVARVPGLDFSFSGLKTALLYAVRELDAGRARAAPRRPRGELPARDRAGARRADAARRPSASAPSGSPSSAASPRTPSSARRCRTPRSRRSRSAPTTRR